MILTCDYCGKEYKTYILPRCSHHYCSRECSSNGRNTKQKVYCTNCNKEIYRRISYKPKSKNYFCSNECLNIWQGRNKVEFICRICGKPFYRSPSWTTEKKGYYCSISCRNKDVKFIENTCIKANAVQCNKRGLNRLELAGNAILDKFCLTYCTQYLINNKICVDVYIPDYNLIIQWDGDYWHGKDKAYDDLDVRVKQRVNRDKSQDAYFRECGFRELRFWESDVMERSEFVYETIKRTIQQFTK